MEEEIINKVVRVRMEMPQIGGRKLYYILNRDNHSLMKGIGRDKSFEVLKRAGLLIKPKRYRVKTTNSAQHSSEKQGLEDMII